MAWPLSEIIATMVLDRSKLILNPEWDSQTKKPKTEEYKFTEGKESHGDHVKNFLDCIRSRQQTGLST